MRIVAADAGAIARLEPLWLAMVAHHRECRPAASQVCPFRAPEDTWPRRRARYERSIDEPDARLLVAEDDDGAAPGYAFPRVGGASRRSPPETASAARVGPSPPTRAAPASAARSSKRPSTTSARSA